MTGLSVDFQHEPAPSKVDEALNGDLDSLGASPGGILTTRETFVKGAIVGGIALALPGTAFAATPKKAAPRRGGRLRVGMVGGGASEAIDVTRRTGGGEIGQARAQLLWERLVDFKPNGELFNRLAEDFSSSKDARVWKMKVRKDVLWHDGKKFSARDVAYTLKWTATKDNKSQGYPDVAFMDPSRIRAIDASTVEIVLDQPNALVPTALSSRGIYVFKNGVDPATTLVGTGPFKYVSFTRGERSLFTRNPNYRIHGGPYVKEVEIISINDPAARLNALLAGQIDVVAQLDPKLIPGVRNDSRVKILAAPSGVWTAQTMQSTVAPFDDNRVRQAMRYLVDRKQVVNNALLGYGRVGNDLFNWFDDEYAREIPQRQHDPERAKSLLKAAGRENLTVTLSTSAVAPAMLESSLLIAEQARSIGVTINIDNAPTDQYWTTRYMKTPFNCTHWGYRPMDAQIVQSLQANAQFNETNWHRPDFDALVNAARRTFDTKKRKELYVAAQKLLWNDGGYIIWGFTALVDAHTPKVKGLKKGVARPLAYYDLTDAYFA